MSFLVNLPAELRQCSALQIVRLDLGPPLFHFHLPPKLRHFPAVLLELANLATLSINSADFSNGLPSPFVFRGPLAILELTGCNISSLPEEIAENNTDHPQLDSFSFYGLAKSTDWLTRFTLFHAASDLAGCQP